MGPNTKTEEMQAEIEALKEAIRDIKKHFASPTTMARIITTALSVPGYKGNKIPSK